MRRAGLFIIALMVLGISISWAASEQAQAQAFNPAGIWVGTISIGGVDIRIVLKIVARPDGSLAATMDSPDQGAKDIPVDTVKVAGVRLQFEMKSIQGTYDGTFNAATKEIEGTWKLPQGQLELKQSFQMFSGYLVFGADRLPVVDGRLSGDQISFRIGDAHYTGNVIGNAMSGTFTSNGNKTVWNANRVAN